MCLGLFQLRRFVGTRLENFFEFLILLPGFLPPIFILLVFFEVLSPFPFGISGIILVHGVMNAGLVAVLLKRIFMEKAIGLSEMALVGGSS